VAGEDDFAGEAGAAGAAEADEAAKAPSAPATPIASKDASTLEMSAPPGMTMIPGGELRWGLTEESVARMHQHCKFSPWFYKRRLKEGGDYIERICKASIRRDFKGVALVKDNSQPTRVAPFLIDRYEVSRGEYQEACNERVVVCPPLPTDRRYARLPIANISYSDASDYCKWRGKRLPTESEWLFAARGEEQSLYPWGSTAIYAEGVYRANYRSLKRNRRERDGHEGPHDVRLSLPRGDSVFGVSHMGGNVREWVRSSGYRHPSAVLGPSWKSSVWLANLMQREAPEDLSWRAEDIGFRCAKDRP
jgi:formylglycine-generating enzyme required for sulfatase activity